MESQHKPGVYLIRHLPSGMTYVGQANRIQTRWNQHKQQLRAGSHHNKALQKYWLNFREEDFQFKVIVNAPEGLSPLQLQRWLVQFERKVYLELKREGAALNDGEPEIAATNAAVLEYQIEDKNNAKAHDSHISAERRRVKARYEELEERIRPDTQRLHELRMELDRRATKIRNLSGWRRLFHSLPQGYNRDEEQRYIECLQKEIASIAPKVSAIGDEIAKLKTEYKSLYQRFTKVSNGKRVRTMFYAFRRIPQKPRISE